MKKITYILLLLSLSLNLFSQDPQVSQFYFSPYYLAPSFAGYTDGTRISMLYRNQWPKIQKEFITYGFSADHYFAGLKSGMGIYFMQDKAGVGNLTTQNIAFSYSYHVSITKNWYFRPGLQIYYQSRFLDFSKLTFGDQISLSGTNPYTIETPSMEKIGYFDFATSFLVEYLTSWTGIAIDHLATPNQSFYEMNESKIPMTFKFFGGYKRYQKGDQAKFKENSITGMFLYKAQGKYDQLDIGGYGVHQPILAGLWYRGIPVLKSYKGYQNNEAL